MKRDLTVKDLIEVLQSYEDDGYKDCKVLINCSGSPFELHTVFRDDKLDAIHLLSEVALRSYIYK